MGLLGWLGDNDTEEERIPLLDQKGGASHRRATASNAGSTLDMLRQLQTVLKTSIANQPRYRNALYDFWVAYKNIFAFSFVIAMTVGTTAVFVISGAGFLRRAARLSLSNWNTLLSNNNMVCSEVYNSIATCIKSVEEEGSIYQVKGISQKIDPVCYDALLSLCVRSCGEFQLSSEFLPQDCHAELTGKYIILGIHSLAVGMISFILFILISDYLFDHGRQKVFSHSLAVSDFVNNHRSLLISTNLIESKTGDDHVIAIADAKSNPAFTRAPEERCTPLTINKNTKLGDILNHTEAEISRLTPGNHR